MPEELHRKLHEEAVKKGFVPGTERYNRYVYGAMQKIEERNSGTK